MRAHHEFLPLAIPAALCAALWAVLTALPAAPARVSPPSSPRLAPQVARAQRPPRHVPASETETETETETSSEDREMLPEVLAPPVAVNVASSPQAADEDSLATLELGPIHVSYSFAGEGDRWTWNPARFAWARRYFAMRRAREARLRAWRDAQRRQIHSLLALGDATASDATVTLSDTEVPSLCRVFGAVCGGARPRSTATNEVDIPVVSEPAVLRREGHRWTLANGIVEATIDPEVLCELTLQRMAHDDAPPPLVFATPERASCDVVETAPADTDPRHGGVALAVTWRGDGWWQQAVVSLGDGAESPEASVTRSTRVGSVRRVEMSNLTASALAWTLDGREHIVASGNVVALER